MADKRKTKKRKEEHGAEKESEKASKEEYAVAKWMRNNVPTKKTKFLSHHVEYFTGSKAVDALLTSKWATGKSPLFTTRHDVTIFLNDMLVHKLFHRAKKVPVSEQELKSRKKKDGDKEKKDKDNKEEKDAKDGEKSQTNTCEEKVPVGDQELKSRKKKDEDKDSKEDMKDGEKSQTSTCEKKEAKESQEKEKRKRKIRLDMHNEQVFLDTADAYVWIYDPIPMHYWFAGLAVLLGAIGVCLFPLWPPTVRMGVYYLSVAGAGFLVFIILLAMLRVVVFCAVWVLTLSRHHLWLLPNLIEDVGFFESFWPLYHYEYRGPSATPTTTKPKKKKKKEKNSDDEAEETVPAPTKQEAEQETTLKQRKVPEPQKERTSESDSEQSQRSSTGRDFEMVESGDVDTS